MTNLSVGLAAALRAEIQQHQDAIAVHETAVEVLSALLDSNNGPAPKPKAKAPKFADPDPKPQRRRRTNGRTREDDVLDQLERGSLTVREIADNLGLRDGTSLYRVVKKLVAEGKISKSGTTLVRVTSPS